MIRFHAGAEHPCTLIYITKHWGAPNFIVWGVPLVLLYFNRFSELMLHKPGQGPFLALLAVLLSPLVGLCGFVECQPPKVVNIAAVFSFDSVIGRSAKTAIEAAIYDINSDPSILKGIRLNTIIKNSKCSVFNGAVEDHIQGSINISLVPNFNHIMEGEYMEYQTLNVLFGLVEGSSRVSSSSDTARGRGGATDKLTNNSASSISSVLQFVDIMVEETEFGGKISEIARESVVQCLEDERERECRRRRELEMLVPPQDQVMLFELVNVVAVDNDDDCGNIINILTVATKRIIFVGLQLIIGLKSLVGKNGMTVLVIKELIEMACVKELQNQEVIQSMSCMNVDTDPNSDSSSPVPIIGVYVTGATLKDVVTLSSLHTQFSNTSYSCCGYKLPVDLTSSMPITLDQLSKLTGTTLICVCMAFLMPSLGLTSYSECFLLQHRFKTDVFKAARTTGYVHFDTSPRENHYIVHPV
ncbi:hypothetical protein Scep_010676 [Stephania cephalantha]|uniref:Uncharacterized protein n=1 Tax=Stephania cephalantha TaxID=152367 RepID=A0AAP0PH97_9MAGN